MYFVDQAIFGLRIFYYFLRAGFVRAHKHFADFPMRFWDDFYGFMNARFSACVSHFPRLVTTK